VNESSERLRLSEAARYLGVSRRWLYRRIWRGELPAAKVGGLYFIRKADLDALVASSHDAPDEGAFLPLPEAEPLKCGACFRLITTDTQIGDVCQAEGCDAILCADCWARGVRYCLRHQPDREARWQQAVQDYRAGKYPLLLRSEQARFRELTLLERVRWNLSRITALRHPRGEAVVSIASWDALETYDDERQRLMELLGQAVLDADTLNRYPLNPHVRYELPPPRSQRKAPPLPPVAIEIAVLSRMETMVRDGFDTRPLDADALHAWLARLAEDVRARGEVRLVLLASVTGWDADARERVTGGGREAAFLHRDLLLYLYDMEAGQLFYNPLDTRLPPYAGILDPALPEERVREAAQALDQIMLRYDTLTLSEAQKMLPYTAQTLQAAFERLAAGGAFALVSLPATQEQALVRK